jgi:hypothetical protein
MARPSLGVPVAVTIAGLAVIGLGQGIVNRQSIEDKLTAASTSALSSAGLLGSVTVNFTGRDATVFAVGEPAARARDIVEGVDGVRVATLVTSADVNAGAASPEPTPATTASSAPAVTVPATAEPTPATAEPTPSTPPADLPLAPNLPIGLTFDGGTLVLSGSVPSQAARDDVLGAAADASFAWKVTDKLTIDPAVANVSKDWFPALTRLINTVPSKGPKLVARYEIDSVILRGVPATRAVEQKILAAAAGTVSDAGSVLDGLDPPAPPR